MNYYNKEIDVVFKELNTSNKGINDEEVKKRIINYGKNIVIEAKKKSKAQRFISQFKDLMIIILIIVAIITLIYGILVTHDYTDPIVIVVVVLINAIMGYIQEQRAEVTLDGLKKYSSSECKVKRNDKIKNIKTSSLVPGDIIILEAGDKVPADARIIFESNLSVDESPLTGESIPVKKTTNVLTGELLMQDQNNMIFSGCNITNGKVEAVVISTGMNTCLGQIAVSLNTPYEVLTPLQVKIKEISTKLTILIFIIIIFVFLYGLIKGYKTMEIIMLCVSLAVAAIPEGLPAVITITLSVGVSALAKKKTVVRQMNSVETLGSTDIICSDKTGTITQNKMNIKRVELLDKEMAYNVLGLCNETINDNGIFVGDPTETCMFDYLVNNGIDPVKLHMKHKRILDAPFDSERKLMSTINNFDDKKYMLVKGSLENLISCCSKKIVEGKIDKLSLEEIIEIKEIETDMANNALRVIALAYKEIKKEISNSEDVIKEENNLIYVGMVGMIDPPRINVKESVNKCLKAGIRPVMITGDSLLTACAIAKDIGIITSSDEGLLGSELDKYTDRQLKDVVKKHNVYARVSPIHKQRIVAAWQANGKVVAMTGDGVNDAPAIKDAHVGVGMGITGTEVTKSVADIILLDDSFSTIVVAVEEGRRIFSNIRNNILYSLSSNFAEIFVVLIGMFTGNTMLLPIQILFIDLVTDSIPSICLAFEKSEKKIMSRKPRGINKPIFTPFMIANIIFSAILETLFVVAIYFTLKSTHGSDIALTGSLLSLVIQEMIYAYSCRNPKIMIFKHGMFSNSILNKGILIVLLIQLIVFLTPLGAIFDVTRMSLSLILKITVVNLFAFIVYECAKPILSKYFKD